jgi:hypothetical protein
MVTSSPENPEQGQRFGITSSGVMKNRQLRSRDVDRSSIGSFPSGDKPIFE